MSNFRKIITLTRYIIECCFIASHFTSMVIVKKLWGFSWIYILFDGNIDAWYFRILFQVQLIFLSFVLLFLFLFFSISFDRSKPKHMNPWRWDLKSPIDVKILLQSNVENGDSDLMPINMATTVLMNCWRPKHKSKTPSIRSMKFMWRSHRAFFVRFFFVSTLWYCPMENVSRVQKWIYLFKLDF